MDLGFEALVEEMAQYFQTEELLDQFVEGVKADIQNKDYQLYLYPYVPVRLFWLLMEAILSPGESQKFE